jgi:hypothetical protein
MRKVVLLLLISLFALSCAHRVQPIYDAEISVPPNTQREDISKAIRGSLVARGWTVTKEEQDMIESQIHVRSHTAVIRIPFNETFIRIKYVSSDHLLYSQEGGTPSIHRNYNKWIKLLEQDIASNLIKLQ